jgi:manganese/zinc/iron transport system ATP- binding protein
VSFWGKSYVQQRSSIAYVPQRESVDWDFPVSVLDVACMGRYGKIGWIRPVSKEHLEIARDALSKVGMADYASRHINQLSGGQQQRVFLARALAQEAKLYFMDEPFTGVDAATEKAIIEVLRELKGRGCSVVCVHHDLSSVPDYFDHVIMLNTRIVAAGPTEEVFNSQNLSQTYGGRLTLLDEVSEAMARASRGH